MTTQEYLSNRLQNCGKYELSDGDQDLISKNGIADFVYAKLTSKKFRKWAVDESSELQAKRAIAINIENNQPIQFRYPFGGYKLWRMPGSPEVDWAEFFSVAYYCQYLAPVAAAYEPGIELIFASDDWVIERMDNIPKADTDAYFASFQKLLSEFGKHLPKNMKVEIRRIGDLYEDQAQMEAELANNVEQLKLAYGSTDKDRRSKMETTSELNIKFDGAKDLTKLSEPEQRAVIEMGPIYHDAYCALPKRRDYNRGEEKIVIFTTPIPNAIALGTTRATITKFWTGYGILAVKGDSYSDLILSPNQLNDLDKTNCRQDIINLIDLKNFSEITVKNT